MRLKKIVVATDERSMADSVMRRGMRAPLFFNVNGESMPIENLMQGTAFLILNGPSVAKMPLHEITRDVYTMTVNNGPRSFRPNANVILDGPDRFSMSVWMDSRITKFAPMTHKGRPLFDNRKIEGHQLWQWSKARVCDCPNVVLFRRNDRFRPESFLHEPTINWGDDPSKGGGRSVMLSAIRILYSLGFSRVLLLGADFHMEAENRYHFEMGASESSAKGNNRTYATLIQKFVALQSVFARAKFEVINCTPGGNLNVFPRMEAMKAGDEARLVVGEWSTEKVDGMYEDELKKKLL